MSMRRVCFRLTNIRPYNQLRNAVTASSCVGTTTRLSISKCVNTLPYNDGRPIYRYRGWLSYARIRMLTTFVIAMQFPQSMFKHSQTFKMRIHDKTTQRILSDNKRWFRIDKQRWTTVDPFVRHCR